MSLKFIKWVPPDIPKDQKDEDDDIDLDNSDSQFKLLALILDFFFKEPEVFKAKDLKGLVSESPVNEFLKNRRSKIESPDELWADIENEISGDHKE